MSANSNGAPSNGVDLALLQQQQVQQQQQTAEAYRAAYRHTVDKVEQKYPFEGPVHLKAAYDSLLQLTATLVSTAYGSARNGELASKVLGKLINLFNPNVAVRRITADEFAAWYVSEVPTPHGRQQQIRDRLNGLLPTIWPYLLDSAAAAGGLPEQRWKKGDEVFVKMEDQSQSFYSVDGEFYFRGTVNKTDAEKVWVKPVDGAIFSADPARLRIFDFSRATIHDIPKAGASGGGGAAT